MDVDGRVDKSISTVYRILLDLSTAFCQFFASLGAKSKQKQQYTYIIVCKKRTGVEGEIAGAPLSARRQRACLRILITLYNRPKALGHFVPENSDKLSQSVLVELHQSVHRRRL